MLWSFELWRDSHCKRMRSPPPSCAGYRRGFRARVWVFRVWGSGQLVTLSPSNVTPPPEAEAYN